MMFDVLYKLRHFFKKHWKRYTFAVIALIFASGLGLVPPKILGYFIDEIQFSTLTAKLLTTIVIIYLSIIVIDYIISYLWDYTLFSGSVILERNLRADLMQHFLKMSPTFFTKYKTGDLMARSTKDLTAIAMTAGFGILTLIDSTTFMSMIILMMGFTISWKLTIAALIPLPFMVFIMNRYGALIHARFTVAQNIFGDLNNSVLESVRGIHTLRAYQQEAQEEARFGKMAHTVYEKNMDVARIDALFEPTMKILVGLSYIIGLGYGALLVFRSALTLGDLVSFNVYLGMLIWPMFAMGELINVMQRGNASLDRVNKVLRYRPDIISKDAPIPLDNVDQIDLKNIDFTYPNTKTAQLVIKDLAIKQGETIGVVGITGAGKTTLFKLLLREYQLQKGIIRLSGIPHDEIDLTKLRDFIGYVPQDQTLFSKSIRANIQFGKQDASDDEIYEVMRLAHFIDDIKRLPERLDTEVGENGLTLSGGQKQRIGLARAFIKNPDILILDDSLSAVDSKTETEIIKHLKAYRKNKTTFIAAHRLSAVMHASQIIVLEAGKIVEHGTHETLMAAKGWYQKQYEQQQMEGDEHE